MPPAGAIFFGRPVAGAAPLHRTSGSSPIRTARDRSWSGATGKPAPPPRRWVPMSRTRPWRACAGTSKVCSRPSAPCAPASALRPRPPRRGGRWLRTAAAPGLRLPPALRSGVTSGHGRFPSPPAWLGLSPPALARRCAAAPAPRSPRYALRAARTAPALGPPARPWAAPCGPDGPPSAPLRARLRPFRAEASAGPPQGGPCSSRLVGRSPPSAVSAGLTGSAPPAWGLERPGGPLSQATGPRRRGEDTAGDAEGG